MRQKAVLAAQARVAPPPPARVAARMAAVLAAPAQAAARVTLPRHQAEAALPRLRPPLPRPRHGQVHLEEVTLRHPQVEAEQAADAAARDRLLQPLPRRKLMVSNPLAGHALADPAGTKNRGTHRSKG